MIPTRGTPRTACRVRPPAPGKPPPYENPRTRNAPPSLLSAGGARIWHPTVSRLAGGTPGTGAKLAPACLNAARACAAPRGVDLTDNSAVPLIVFSPQREPSEFINSLMRKAGEPVHCTWIPAVRDLGEALEQLNPELLVCAYVSETEAQAGRDRARPARSPGPDAAGAPADFRSRHRRAACASARATSCRCRPPIACRPWCRASCARSGSSARSIPRCSRPATTAASCNRCCSAPTTPSCRCRKASWSTPTRPGSSCSATRMPARWSASR